MKIIRVLNTNAVLTKDLQGDETILIGVGIGFKAKPGFEIDESKIEKKFILKDKQEQFRFQELLTSIPSDYILVAEQIISFARDSFHLILNESIHISLADHLYNAIQNYQNGITVPGTLLLDIMHYYPTEYKLAEKGLKLI
ncbi:MAG: CAT RNA binding domain-containing protein, partial [Lachnospiraceae bacterium]